MWTRRQFLTRSTLGVLGVTSTGLAFQGDALRDAMPDGSQAHDMMTTAAEGTVKRGLEYLKRRQGRDGEWGNGPQYPANVAITSLAALAMMSGGSQVGRGPYGDNIRRALEFVLRQSEKPALRVGPSLYPSGFLFNTGHMGQGPMYSHGFGTLFLGEVCGMLPDDALQRRVRKALGKAVQIILASQSDNGGWRYNPWPGDADISVTVCQMMALRSAKNAGVVGDDPQRAKNASAKAVRDRCIRYVKDSQQKSGDGSFVYQLSHPNFAFPGFGGGFARAAAGIAALYSAGAYNDPDSKPIIEAGLRYMVRNRPPRFAHQPADMHYFYGHYYAVQCMWTAGGTYWSDWFPFIRDELIKYQELDGSWADQISSDYGAAMACIILQVPNNYLPILQK